MKNKFPVIGTFLLVVGIVWLLQGLGIITINLPWIPILLILIGGGIIFNRFNSK